MSKSVVILICVLTVAVFAGLSWYGWTHRWGGPMDTSVTPPLVLTMPWIDKTLGLDANDLDDGVWQSLQPLTVPLLHQISTPPRGKHLVPKVDVRTFHNGTDAYFLFEWKDASASRVHDIERFPDGVAVGFSIAEKPPNSSIMMGFGGPINIWQWKADLDAMVWGVKVPRQSTPNVYYTYLADANIPTLREKPSSACQDLVAIRPGTVTPKDNPAVNGRGRWRDGAWRVIITRKLATDDVERDAQLTSSRMHVTFAVWDGDKGDRGSRKSISEWVILKMGTQAAAPAETSANVRRPRYVKAGLLANVPSGTEKEPRVINILAERFVYTPSEITLQKGERVTFRLESLDVTHGLFLDGYGVKLMARPGVIGKATFTADKTGRFTFRCSETCGEFHPYMIGYVNVVPNTQYHTFVAVALGVFVVAGALALIRKTKKAVPND